MWIGKIALILYVFSFGLLFFTYFVNNSIFADPVIANAQIHDPTLPADQTTNLTYDSLDHIVRSFSFNQTPDPALIFGDFLSAFKLIFGLMTGSVFTDSLHLMNVSGAIPVLDSIALGIVMGAMFDLATALLLLYILSGRSL